MKKMTITIKSEKMASYKKWSKLNLTACYFLFLEYFFFTQSLTSDVKYIWHAKTVQSFLPQVEWCKNTVRVRKAGRRRHQSIFIKIPARYFLLLINAAYKKYVLRFLAKMFWFRQRLQTSFIDFILSFDWLTRYCILRIIYTL